MTASDGASYDYFGESVAISGAMLLVGDWVKCGGKGATCVFVLAGDISWDEITRLGNGIASGDFFGSTVAISGDRSLNGDYHSDEKGPGSGTAYIFHWVDGV